MKPKIIFLTLLLSIISFEAFAKKASLLLTPQEDSKRLTVNNCILAKVNGKPISVIDVMKKMDILFYRQFPEYTSSLQARFQFYEMNWKYILDELINKELILADAQEVKLSVTAGDVRQEMETLFGPNIIANLDKTGLSFDEAMKIVQGDLTIQRMLYYRVNSKVIRKLTPQSIRAAYEKYAQENILLPEWHYHVISIRDKDISKGAEVANLVYRLLLENTPITDLKQKVKEIKLFEKTSVNISEEYCHTDKEISDSYKDILNSLSNKQVSHPIAQKSRKDKSMVFRLFYLKEFREGGKVPFSEVENKIKNQLLDEMINNETDLYLKKLRQHFDVEDAVLTDMLNDHFLPFSL